MAVSVDRVYQTVLAIANKEQRGYITPQEFNLFANQAQNEIFESYYYDLYRSLKIPGNKTITSDQRDIIEEKLSIFRVTNEESSGTSLSPNVYKLETVRLRETSTGNIYVAEEVTKREYDLYELSPLTRPSVNRPIFYRSGYNMYYSPSNLYNGTFVDYITRPVPPNWTYNTVQGAAMYNPNSSTQNFELHASEEKALVVKILQFAGVAIKDYNLSSMAGQKEANYAQQEQS